MIGIVVVSHSRRLAEAAVELALQMVRGARPPIEIAAGLDGGVLGTDALDVGTAIERAATPDGVLVLMDLGSAVLSAELAVELAGDDRPAIVLSEAPIVEGLVAAVVCAAGGGTLADVAAEAASAAEIKAKLLGVGMPVVGDPGEPDRLSPAPSATVDIVLHNAHGLHARPAARLVETIGRFDADVAVRNLSIDGPLVSGRSISAVSTLGALAGHRIEFQAGGRQAREALAAVVALVRRNFDEAAPTTEQRTPTSGPIAAAPGIGIGPKCSVAEVRRAARPVAQAPEQERARLVAAVAAAREHLRATRAHVAAAASEQEAAIFDAHLLLLADDELVSAALRYIDDERISAEQAWATAVQVVAARFSVLADDYQRARVADVQSVGQQVEAALSADGGNPTDGPEGVLVATDLSPVQAAHLDPTRVVAVVTTHGSPVSHGSILARSLGIPMVVAVGDALLDVDDGTTLIVDGTTGAVIVDPSPEVEADYVERVTSARRRALALEEQAAHSAHTIDGSVVEVAANIGAVDDVATALRFGADSVGLLRSEFLFLNRRLPPSEAEQEACYRAIAEGLDGRRLTIRTLDVGGDKHLPYIAGDAEANPFLGRRGLRLSLEEPELFTQQLCAVIRVAQDHPVTLIFPMVSTVDELRAARALLEAAAREVGCPGGELPNGFEVGAMVEVPAFALNAGAAAHLVDVFSIGTNDLTQYTLAAERGNAAVARLADPLDPAVLRLIAMVAQAAGDSIRVSVCGELAADPTATAILIGLGVDELSMAPPAIPAAKEAVRSTSLAGARDLARRALEQATAANVRALITASVGDEQGRQSS